MLANQFVSIGFIVYRLNSEVSLVYRGSLEPEPLSLQQLAREEINQAVDGRSLDDLGLPTRLRRFLLYEA